MSSIIFGLFARDIYFSLSVILSLSTASEMFCSERPETFVILSAVLLPIKSPVTSAIF